MSKIDKTLERMRNNPRDWRIDDLEAIANRFGIDARKHGGGSHVVFHHKKSTIEISVPAHKPVKQVYIKRFLELIDDIKD
jgi:hypothetical protein